MKEFKGTKGEWYLNEKESSIHCDNVKSIADRHYHIEFADDGEIAQCWADLYDSKAISEDECLANARLMAASPDLLESLQDLVRFCEENNVSAELELAKKAIDKALG